MSAKEPTIILISIIVIIAITFILIFKLIPNPNAPITASDIDSNSLANDTNLDLNQVVDVDPPVIIVPDKNTITDTNTTPTIPTFTSAQVATHKTRSDCYMIISGKVYDFSSYISKHPGGSTMVGYCGKDGTSQLAWHSKYANSLIAKYYVGELN